MAEKRPRIKWDPWTAGESTGTVSVDPGCTEAAENAGIANPWTRWQARNTRKTAVHAMCWQCMGGGPTDVRGIREAIRGCTAPGCPLFAWRPYREKS